MIFENIALKIYKYEIAKQSNLHMDLRSPTSGSCKVALNVDSPSFFAHQLSSIIDNLKKLCYFIKLNLGFSMISNGDFDNYQKHFMERKSADFRLESTDC